ncbi:MAG: GNAT family N-acetyltransferase [Candidatus Koribacter versatilis]|uniref:GNAT family N-acetyltransferase n=1 Tax=Candidatus Korobacter versatilis TaxID=658062 RepID=A0A932A9V1_9BACT|nr:GNAT family N-acetyltransferase [Candidatus Koribacter versatilis]
MEILDLRHFTSAELRGLLEREAELWARTLSWDYRASAEMILRYLDAKILPGYAAVDAGAVHGYSFFVYEGAKGVIGDLYVDDSFGAERRRATEQKLLTHVIETLRNSPGIHRIEAQLLVHETGAVAQPFVREGFSKHARLFMSLPISGPQSGPQANATAARELPGIDMRRWSEDDFQPGAAVITAAYRNHVDSEINDQYRTIAGSLRFLNNIVRFPGCGVFDAESSLVAIDRASRQTIGVILCSRVKDDVGHVTQVCVLPEHRGRGIGEALIAASAADLRRRRFAALSLTVTEGNARAVELYRRMGFDVKRVFDAFVWEG